MSTDHLLWLDLETTGTDEAKDSIIEIGCILTTPDLTAIDEFATPVLPTDEALGRMMRTPVVREMHEANGLLELVLDGIGELPHDAAGMVLNWLADNGAQRGATVLAGSGVAHFDRRFLGRWMPQVDRFLRHWCIDVGVIRRAVGMWAPSVPQSDANDGKTHRALDDARCHLGEARHWADLFGAVKPAGEFA